jgi:hypothetical protein
MAKRPLAMNNVLQRLYDKYKGSEIIEPDFAR